MSGHLAVVGLGAGDRRWLTPEADAALAGAEALYGYRAYLDRVPARPGQARHASDNREEGARAAAALRHAAQGANVALVSGGDPGVFAMAAAVCEEIESGPDAWRALDVDIVPGVTAMLAVAARIGAPLGHDFCALSLSDNRKPWELIERRLDAAASGGFVIALYNPISQARPWQLGAALERLRERLTPSIPVVFGRAVGRPDERVTVTTLAFADPAAAAVLRHHHLDAVGSEKRPLVGLSERPARGDVAGVLNSERRINGIDAAHEIMVLRRSHEGGELLAAQAEKHPARRIAESSDR